TSPPRQPHSWYRSPHPPPHAADRIPPTCGLTPEYFCDSCPNTSNQCFSERLHTLCAALLLRGLRVWLFRARIHSSRVSLWVVASGAPRAWQSVRLQSPLLLLPLFLPLAQPRDDRLHPQQKYHAGCVPKSVWSLPKFRAEMNA